jgi:2-iminobutanoate/2-iminopropanoate deaminase
MKTISTEKAPRAIGPYSQGMVSGGLVFCSGQIAIDPDTNEYKPGSIAEETTRAIENLKAILEAAGTRLEKTVRVGVYLASMDDFVEMNGVYETFFTNKPARTTIEISKLPKGARIEIDAVAEM